MSHFVKVTATYLDNVIYLPCQHNKLTYLAWIPFADTISVKYRVMSFFFFLIENNNSSLLMDWAHFLILFQFIRILYNIL